MLGGSSGKNWPVEEQKGKEGRSQSWEVWELGLKSGLLLCPKYWKKDQDKLCVSKCGRMAPPRHAGDSAHLHLSHANKA